MIRALAVCAFVSFISSVSAETGSNKAVVVPQPTVAAPAPIAISACGEANCPATPRDATARSQRPQHALLKQKLAEMNCLQSEIDELRRATGTPQQIHINVQVLEVSRTKLRQTGVDYARFGTQGQATSSQLKSLFEGNGAGGQMCTIDDSAALGEFVDWLRQSNLAKVLADPSIVTASGRPTSFHVGGELPIPAAPESPQAIEFKSFGTQVDVLALALGDNRARMELRVRVSELDESLAIKVAGKSLPAIRVRQIDAPIELQFG